jgi:acyl carrier protein
MLETIKEIITMYAAVDPEEITLETNLRTDLALNSLILMNMIVEVEDTFGIEVPESDIMTFDTVGDVVAYLENVVE